MMLLNFGGLPEPFTRFDSSKIVILPVPYDGTSTWIKGADKGPEAILEASANMELYDMDTDSEVYTLGIHTAEPLKGHRNPEEMVRKVENTVGSLLDNGKFVVTLGGEHSVSIGAIYAHSKHFSGLSVLQLDAHTDLRPEYEGSRYNHACVMSRTSEVCHFVQAGIRSMDVSEKAYTRPEDLFTAENIRRSDNWQKKLLDRLQPEVYITLDLDVFDPSVLPSTGTPEPGGLGWYEVIDLIRLIVENRKLVGMDVVELCPNPDARASDFLAAKLIYQTLSMLFQKG